MAVTEVRVRTERGGQQGQKHERGYTLTYLVTTSDSHDGPMTVFAALPQIGDVYATNNELDLGARVVSVALDHVDGDPRRWRAEVEFSNEQGEDPDNQDPEDPLDREPKYSVRFDESEEVIHGPYNQANPGFVDLTASLTNSAKQPFNPPPTKEVSRLVIRMVQDDDQLRLGQMREFQDAINLTAFAGFAAKTLKLRVSDIEERFEHGMRLWRKTYELKHKPETWDQFILDHGTVPDEDGNMVEVLLLNGSKTTNAPQYKQYTVYRTLDFNTSTDVPATVKRLQFAPL